MTMEKFYVDGQNKIAVSCPQCGVIKDIDVSTHLGREGITTFEYLFICDKCDCGHKECEDCPKKNCTHGHKQNITLERRKFFRKEVNLAGSLTDLEGKKHPVRVLNLSRTGLKIKILTTHDIQPAQTVYIEFNLDNANETLIKKDLLVKQASSNTIETEFSDSESYDRSDKAIGFYLLS